MRTEHFTIPTYLLTYFAYGDWDNITKEEKNMADEWWAKYGGSSFDITKETYFAKMNDITNVGAEVIDIIMYYNK